MSNHLKNQTSPYLLQHAENPVDWYPWCEEAFEHARKEDKPIFLSIGYSTCHWCHVMAHESFEDEEIAEILNQHFISVKVDKEERPDIDSIYMSVCQAFTGSGGWPTSIFMTAEQKPFFAGTYYPKTTVGGHAGFKEILQAIIRRWNDEEGRTKLMEAGDEIISLLDDGNGALYSGSTESGGNSALEGSCLIEKAMETYGRTFDEKYGGFGAAPKFPTPHNLMFLMRHYEKNGDRHALFMAEKTLTQMYRGGIFDHIGGGFSRYSTDEFYLVPYFEKMLYDNALFIMAYSKAYQLTRKRMYRCAAEQTAEYIMREMMSGEGGFFSAQDADSEGVEGKFYLFEKAEIMQELGDKDGEAFCRCFDVSERGNFERKNIPNLLKSGKEGVGFEASKEKLYEYRRNRYSLHLDDKILTSWNSLMIAAMCRLHRVTGKEEYLKAALRAQDFIEREILEDGELYISWRNGQKSGKGLLDDYAFQVMAQLSLYEATLDTEWLKKAERLCGKAVKDFHDERGGFFMYGEQHEQLILRPKETYDGAVFSGNSAMAYNLVRLWLITDDDKYEKMAEQQLMFMEHAAERYPAGHSVFLMALMDFIDTPDMVTAVMADDKEPAAASALIPLDMVIKVQKGTSESYPLKNGLNTYYVCRNHSCLPPLNDLAELKLR